MPEENPTTGASVAAPVEAEIRTLPIDAEIRAVPVEAEIRAVPNEVPAPAVAGPDIASIPLAPTTPEPAPAPVPVRSEPISIPAAVVDVQKALTESGLVLIQTDPSKVKRAEPLAEPQIVPAAPRPRRAPPPDTGPLQIVETKK